MNYKNKKKLIGILFGAILLFSTINLYNFLVDQKKDVSDQVLDNDFPKNSQSPIQLRYGVKYGPVDLDPHYAWDTASFDVIEQVVETLFAYDLTDPELQPIPRLASDYGEWLDGGLIYRVPLRPTITFHDGEPFNANAVIWNFERLNYFMNFHEYTTPLSLLYQWSDGTPIIEMVNYINQYEVEFVLSRPYAPFLSLLCFSGSGIMSPSSTPATDFIDALTGDLVGTGPFVYDEYVENEEVRFYAYENYWAGAPNIDELIFSIILDDTERTQALLDGHIDFLDNPANSMLQYLRDNLDITLVETVASTTICSLGMNNKFIGPHWRQAISYAIDYDYMIEELLLNMAVRLKSPLPEGILYANSSFNYATLNIIKAREILQNYDIGLGLDINNDVEWITVAQSGSPLATFNYTYNLGNQFREDFFVLLKNNLEYIGVKAIDQGLEWDPYVNLIYNLDGTGWDKLRLFWICWLPDFNDPSNYLNNLMSNISFYNNAQINDPLLEMLLEQGLSETDPIARETIYDTIQQYLVKDLVPWAWGYTPKNYDAYNNSFSGFQSNAMGKVWFFSVIKVLDNTPPETSIELRGVYALDGWYYSDVVVSLWAEDWESGVDFIQYRINNGDWIEYIDSLIVSDEGTTIIYYRSIDNNGNMEEVKVELIEIHPRPVNDTVVIYGIAGGPPTIDPHDAWDTDSFNVIEQVIETLFAYNLSAPDMTIIPRLALDYGSWSTDGLTYIVPLRSGIYFHDGAYFDAWVVKWSFDRLFYFMNLENPTQISSLYRWPDGTPIIDHVEVEDAYTIKFILSRPFAALEALLCFSGSGILSPISTPPYNYIDTFVGDLVGTGPFIYDEYLQEKGIRFHSNEDYWQGPPLIKDLWFLIIEDTGERNDALIERNIDLLTEPLNTMLDTFEADPNIIVEGGQGTIIYYLSINNNLIDKITRQAISYAINYSYIIEEIYNGFVARLKSPIPEGIRYANWSFNVATMNRIRAREILQENGIGLGLDPTNDDEWIAVAQSESPLATYNYIFNIGNLGRENFGYLLQDNLAYIGIKLEVEALTWDEFVQRVFINPNSVEMVLWGWIQDYNDPSNYVNSLLSVDSPSNLAQVNDPYLQDLLNNGLEIVDPIVREAIYDEIQRYCVEDLMPWAYLFVNLQYDAYNSKIMGFQWNPMGKVWFYPIYLSWQDLTPPTIIYDTIPDEIKITYTRSAQIIGSIKAYDVSNIFYVGWEPFESPDPGFSLITTYNEGEMGGNIIYFSETLIMTTNLLEPGIHSLNIIIVDDQMNTYVKSFTVEVYRQAELKLSGEFDYLEKEKVKISISAQVLDLEEKFLMIPTSDIDFTVYIRIVDYNGVIIVEDSMSYDSNGFFHWDSIFTINDLKNVFPKGIYIVQGWIEFSYNSYYEGGNDIIQFHIDPPGSFESNSWSILEIFSFGGLIIALIGLTFLFLRERWRSIGSK